MTGRNYQLNHDQVNYINVTPKEVETVIRVSQPKQNAQSQMVLEQNPCTFLTIMEKFKFLKISKHIKCKTQALDNNGQMVTCSECN